MQIANSGYGVSVGGGGPVRAMPSNAVGVTPYGGKRGTELGRSPGKHGKGNAQEQLQPG